MRTLLGPAPSNATDAATKAYVDSRPSGGGGTVNSVVAGAGIAVDSSTPSAPIVSATGPVRSSVTSTVTLAAGAHNSIYPVLGITFRLLTIQTSKPARVRVYSTDAARIADGARAVGTDPASDAGVILEYVTTDTATHSLSPVVTGGSLEATPSASIEVIVTNNGTSGDVSVTFGFERIA